MDPQKRAQAELDELLKEIAVPPQGDAPQSDTGQPPAPADTPPVPAPTPEPAAPAPEPAAPDPQWQHRFESLQGKYNAEVPRLHAELRDLRNQLAQLRSQPMPAAPAPVEETEHYQALVEEYGEKAAKAMLGLTRSEATKASETVVQREIQPVAQSVQDQSRELLHTQIARLSDDPGWETLGFHDPGFNAWTQQNVDHYSGKTLNQLLNEAYSAGDAVRVARFITDYKAAIAPPPSTTPPAPTAPAPGQVAMTVPPKRSTAAGDMTDTNPGKVWTTAEIDKFYAEWTNSGKYRGKEAEAKAIEKEILSALAEGRVLG